MAISEPPNFNHQADLLGPGSLGFVKSFLGIGGAPSNAAISRSTMFSGDCHAPAVRNASPGHRSKTPPAAACLTTENYATRHPLGAAR